MRCVYKVARRLDIRRFLKAVLGRKGRTSLDDYKCAGGGLLCLPSTDEHEFMRSIRHASKKPRRPRNHLTRDARISGNRYNFAAARSLGPQE